VTKGIGGRPSLRFGTGQGLIVEPASNFHPDTITLFLVWRSDKVIRHEALLLGQAPPNHSFQLGLYGENQLFFSTEVDGQYRRVNSNRQQGRGAPELIEAMANGQEVQLVVNGQVQGRNPGPGRMTPSSEPIYLGGQGPREFIGLIAEFILYERALEESERCQVGCYLAQRYGFEPGIYGKVDLAPSFEPSAIEGCRVWLEAGQVDATDEH
jgi:hypothetical protein